MEDKELSQVQEKRPIGRPKGSKDTHARPSRRDLSWKGNETLLPGDNARYVKHALSIAQWPRIDIEDPEQVQERIWQYFSFCAETDQKPGVAGLSLALGIDRRTFYNWWSGATRSKTHASIAQSAKQVLEALWEDYAQNGKVNPVIAIFTAKNHFNYRDQNEVVLSPQTAYSDNYLSAEELQQKYIEACPSDYDPEE